MQHVRMLTEAKRDCKLLRAAGHAIRINQRNSKLRVAAKLLLQCSMA
jgi:hypothetical protein